MTPWRFPRFCAVLLLCAALPALLLSPPSARERIGDLVPCSIESPHPLPGGVWRQEVTRPGATLLRVRAAALEIGPGDRLIVLDGDGQVVETLTGPVRPGTWLPIVLGDRLVLEIRTEPGSSPWGLKIDQLAVGTRSPWAEGAPESLCGTDNRRDPACYDASMQAAADAVGRMFVVQDGFYLCTGELVSAQDHFLSNNHCVSTQDGAASVEVWWKYQYSGCGSGSADKDTVTRGADLLDTDVNLDYSLMRFQDDNPSARYGFLAINPAEPVVGSRIWIPQHAQGNPKKFAVESDMDAGGLALVGATDLEGTGGTGSTSDFGYFADTQGGSSGSPVLDDQNRILGLHHWGIIGSTCYAPGNLNQAIKMSAIYPRIASFLEPCILTCEAAAPAAARAGFPAPFTATASAQNCSGTPSFAWDFGDGQTSDQQDTVHAFATAGTFTWKLTVMQGGESCTREGVVLVAPRVPGDCDGDGVVSIGEVQGAINMYLGTKDPGCGVDCDGDGIVSIGEVQKVINGFLDLPASC